jgi:hypothetical protein
LTNRTVANQPSGPLASASGLPLPGVGSGCPAHRGHEEGTHEALRKDHRYTRIIRLLGSFRDGGELTGCDHETVVYWVAERDAGELGIDEAPQHDKLIGPYKQ